MIKQGAVLFLLHCRLIQIISIVGACLLEALAADSSSLTWSSSGVPWAGCKENHFYSLPQKLFEEQN